MMTDTQIYNQLREYKGLKESNSDSLNQINKDNFMYNASITYGDLKAIVYVIAKYIKIKPQKILNYRIKKLTKFGTILITFTLCHLVCKITNMWRNIKNERL